MDRSECAVTQATGRVPDRELPHSRCCLPAL